MTIIQDQYPDHLSVCYGCGRLNEQGLQIKSHWDGEQAVLRFTPSEAHQAVPGYVYGGLLASLIDCHGTGTACAAAAAADGRPFSGDPNYRFVTGNLNVSYRRPTKMGVELKIVGRAREVKPRKVIVDIEVYAEDELTVVGELIAVKMPPAFQHE
jgi:acyl-coenzyme A thioesterase PaaI-like protein